MFKINVGITQKKFFSTTIFFLSVNLLCRRIRNYPVASNKPLLCCQEFLVVILYYYFFITLLVTNDMLQYAKLLYFKINPLQANEKENVFVPNAL